MEVWKIEHLKIRSNSHEKKGKRGLCMEVRLSKKTFNGAYLPYLDCRARYLVLYGGAGSGKSVFAVQRFLYRLMGKGLCNLLVVRAVAASHRDSTFALFCQIIRKWSLERLFLIRRSELQIQCIATGNTVIFKGLDDVEKLKSVTFPQGELTEIWVEEASEISQGDFNQLDIRLRGKDIQGQIVLTFNPISALHWLKRQFFDRQRPNAVILKTTYRDNRFLTEDYCRLLEAFRETDPYYYSVYCLGEWGVLGHCIFDAAAVNRRIAFLGREGPSCLRGEFVYDRTYDPARQQLRIPRETIRFLSGAGEETPFARRHGGTKGAASTSGIVRIYRPPEPGVSYVIGGDTAGEGSDFFVGQVLRQDTGEQVCTLRHSFDEDLYAKQLYCLGRWYNDALIAVEANYSSYPIKVLAQLGYPRQYVREKEDSYTHRPQESYGFRTSSVTRPLILGELVRVVREEIHRIWDPDTLSEMLTFVRNESGRPEAQQGAHDDCLMALAIAHYARAQGGGSSKAPPSLKHWTPDMKLDYQNASPAQRQYLQQKWR